MNYREKLLYEIGCCESMLRMLRDELEESEEYRQLGILADIDSEKETLKALEEELRNLDALS